MRSLAAAKLRRRGVLENSQYLALFVCHMTSRKRNAREEIGRNIDRPPPLAPAVLRGDPRLKACADFIADGKRVELTYRMGSEDPTATRIQQLLSQEAALGDRSSSLFLEQAIDLLCVQIIGGHSSIGDLPSLATRRGLADWQVKRVTHYMRDHLDQEIALQELAGLVSLSRFHFCTAFRMATGHTPHEWLTVQRIQRAKALLTNPKLAITHVALAVGYQTPSAFAATFRKIAGVTPTEFRRSL
jgi:AraC family transcriptional regulator